MPLQGFVVGDRILGAAADSHADWCAGYGRLGAYEFLAGSALGKLHVRDGRARDDAFAARSAGPWLAVAVADGAGSRKLSRYGASFAVDALCEHLLREATGAAPGEPSGATLPQAEDGPVEGDPAPSASAPPEARRGFLGRLMRREEPKAEETPAEPANIAAMPAFDTPDPIAPAEDAAAFGTLAWRLPGFEAIPDALPAEGDGPAEGPADLEEGVRRAFRRVRAGLEQFALQRQLPLRELPCTLMGLLLNTETGALAAGHIGDGLVAMLHPGIGARALVEAPTPGSTGETYAITQSDWEQYLAVRTLSPREAAGMATFYLMTDGVADDCTHPPPEGIFDRWARDMDREVRKQGPLPRRAARLLRWLNSYEARGSWDDRTLVVILAAEEGKSADE